MAKTAIVTGGARGIGKAVALQLAKAGYNIVVNYLNTTPDELTAEIAALDNGVICLPIQGDVSDFTAAENIVKTAKKELGSVDVLVNNAGITRDMLLLRMSEEEFDKVINTNLKGAFNMLRHTSNVMLKQKSGAIINMSSVVGVTGNIGQVNYAAAKAGIIGMTKAAARELASRGITCNAIAPGFIETAMTEALSDDIKEKTLASIPLKRYGKVEEVAELTLFLAQNTYITGQVINLDGGMVM